MKEYFESILSSCIIVKDSLKYGKNYYYITSTKIKRQKKLCRILKQDFIYDTNQDDNIEILFKQQTEFKNFWIENDLIEKYKDYKNVFEEIFKNTKLQDYLISKSVRIKKYKFYKNIKIKNINYNEHIRINKQNEN